MTNLFDSLTPADLLTRIETGGGLAFVAEQRDELQAAGVFEWCLATAIIVCRTNHHDRPDADLQALFEAADRSRLRAAGQPLPRRRMFRLYRGISGRGAARRPQGWAWTPSFNRAAWYAARDRLPHPAVLLADIPTESVLCYTNDRRGETFLVRPAVIHRFRIMPRRIHELADQEQAAMETRYDHWLDRLAAMT